jgi:hypothetical protein
MLNFLPTARVDSRFHLPLVSQSVVRGKVDTRLAQSLAIGNGWPISRIGAMSV